MHRERRTMLSQAVNERVKALRPYLPQAMALAQQQVPGDFIRMRDGYAGLRYIGRVLYNTRDLQHVTYVPHEEVFMLLIDGIVGAAQYRIGKRRKSGMGV